MICTDLLKSILHTHKFPRNSYKINFLQLSVIIVNYNVKFFLEQCLYAVKKACAGIESEVLVIDNNSTDGSRDWLEQKFDWVQFTWQETNDGFGKANNKLLKEAKGEYILFLNPDTIIAEDCLQLCLQEMKRNKNTGGLGVRMIDGSGKFLKESKRGFPTPAASFFKMSGMASLFSKSKIFAQYYAGHLDQKESHDVDVLAGAFMLLSRKAADATNGFDEDFFMYGEDVDLSYRIQKAGMQNRYFAGTSIIHFKGESTQKYSAGYNQHFYGAMKLFVKKHFAEKKALVFFTGLAISSGRIIASAKSLFPKKINNSGKQLNTVVAGGQEKFDECIKLLKYADPALFIKGRIAVSDKDSGPSLGHLSNVNNIAKKGNVEQLVFCEGELSFKSIIQQAERTSPKIQLLFHAEGSRSIAGSSNKNTKGRFIFKP
jgi:GT2 family glycosyltransferase